jgi:putative tryptophan/tyrosine transport system substrate-binding protein
MNSRHIAVGRSAPNLVRTGNAGASPKKHTELTQATSLSSGTASTKSLSELETARAFGLQLHVLYASSERDFDAVFATIAQVRAGGLVINADPFLQSRSEQLASLALRHALPAIAQLREFVAAGGSMSYAGSIREQLRQVGIYTGRILKGEKPADLSAQGPTKFELVINLQIARVIGLTIPEAFLLRADELIE